MTNKREKYKFGWLIDRLRRATVDVMVPFFKSEAVSSFRIFDCKNN
jgi:hypothetical protein